ncbi:MATE family efflux transporter [Bradyrhizobium sp. 30]|nr:MATE family efflux transporter [Bradyrhizobium sp. 30]
MVLTQVGQIAMITTDLAFIGRLGPESLAGAALATRIYLVCFTFAGGLLAAITPLVAQAFGRDNLALVRRSLRMGIWTALLLSLPTTMFALRGERMLLSLGQEPAAARLAQEYLLGLACGMAPALCFQSVRHFMGAVNRPEPALWITLATVPLNALLVYLLSFGTLGLPRLELFGVGLATTLVNYATLLAGLCSTKFLRPFRDYHVLVHFWRFDWPVMRQLFVIGTPISVVSLIGYALMLAAALLAGRISSYTVAVHQIVLQVAAILFMVSSGISTAAGVRVSQAVGRNDVSSIKRATLVAMLLGVLIATILTFVVIAARMKIAELFLGGSGRDADAIIRLAAKLLLVSGTFFIADAAQIIAVGALRGLKDTRVPVLFAVIAHWLIGFSLSYVLGLKVGLGAFGIWIGLSIGAAINASLLIIRFRLLAKKACSSE